MSTFPARGVAQTMDGVEALRALSGVRTNELVVLSESTRQDWPPLSRQGHLDIGITGSMSKASSFGLGVALARPERPVWVLDTDGALLMNLGSLVTIAAMKPANLLHVLYENGAYDTTGGQPVPGAGTVDFRALALDAGYPSAFSFDDLGALGHALPEVLVAPRPALVVFKVASRGRRPNMQLTRMYDSFVTLRDYLAQQPS